MSDTAVVGSPYAICSELGAAAARLSTVSFRLVTHSPPCGPLASSRNGQVKLIITKIVARVSHLHDHLLPRNGARGEGKAEYG
jgi:hypothetical protein